MVIVIPTLTLNHCGAQHHPIATSSSSHISTFSLTPCGEPAADPGCLTLQDLHFLKRPTVVLTLIGLTYNPFE